MNTEYKKLNNTRNLGGMKTVDGRKIQHGLLFRSGHLSGMDPSDAQKLHDCVRTIIDFRTDRERVEKPDTELPGVSYIHIPVIGSSKAGITREERSDRELFIAFLRKPQEAKEYMCEMYKGFTTEHPAKQYSRFVRVLADAEGGVLWHCTVGKDRAGIASVIVEEILGVPREDIIADYMATADYLAQSNRVFMEHVKKKLGMDDSSVDEAFRYLLGVDKEYINTFYTAVSQKYGDMKGFLHDALAVSDEMITDLRTRYLK
ncbi:MAG: tyrosine-protein phosphatase [Mogibacterium sp.]|nr:tyrosine-protein phosphatase [Mogibacterium sp.]